MTGRYRWVALVLGLAGCAGRPEPETGPEPPPGPDPGAIVAEADRLAAQALWPGFDPRAIPVAIYQDGRTLLFRHPRPPEGFEPVPGNPSVASYPGRYPAVTANSSAEIGGVPTATLMPAAPGESVTRRAGVLLHEAFHVFQRRQHPRWIANEADLFTYPVEEPAGALLRNLEVEALRRALLARTPDRTACWAREASRLRHERFARLSRAAVAYERGTELNEGLAAYVQHRAMVDPDTSLLPLRRIGPEAVRQRAYGTGAALARLLDRLAPAWRDSLERNDSVPLDSLLAVRSSLNLPACGFTRDEERGIEAATAASLEALRVRRSEQRRRFLAREGWSLVVLARAAPLFPQGFDPLNVESVAPGEVLHTRYLKLGGPAGEIEIIGRPALTLAAGEHPLFNGVQKLVVTGLPGDPVSGEAGALQLKGEGLSGSLRGTTVERTGRTVTLTLGEMR